MKLKYILPLSLLSLTYLHALETPPTQEKALAHESEGAVVLVGGNSSSQTYSVKQKTSYTLGLNKLTAFGHYLMGKAGSKVSAENWDGGLRYDYAFNEKLGAYLGETVVGDRFRDIHLEYDTDIGMRYTFWKVGENDYALGELGYRLTDYDYIVAKDQVTDFARVYAEAAKSISSNLYGKLWVEYLPSIDRTKKYLINFEPSINVKLSDIFALKTGFLGNYDSEPKAKRKFDYTYTAALVAKY